MKIKSPRQMLSQFASTYKEWHYFIGGLSLGVIIGWFAKALLRKYVETCR